MSFAPVLVACFGVIALLLTGRPDAGERLDGERPVEFTRASSLASEQTVVGVENGPNVSTTVRIYNGTDHPVAVRVALSDENGVHVAECEIERIQTTETADWCIQPSDFGDKRLVSARIQGNLNNPDRIGVQAFVTTVRRGVIQQVIERPLPVYGPFDPPE